MRTIRLRAALLVPALAAAVVLAGAAPAEAAVTGTVNPAVLASPNGSDFTWTCDVNPGGATIWVMGRSWNDPTNGVPGIDTPRQQISGSTTQRLTFARDGAENQAYGYRCLWYATATTATVLGKTASALFITTGIDNDPPTAVLTQPDPVDEDTATTLTAVDSTDPDDGIATYDWDFGDGTSSTGHAWWFVDHVYADPGTYTVTVTVRDAGGLTDTDSKQLTVLDVNDPPEAGLTADLTTVVTGAEVLADASTSTDPQPGDVLSYTFDFGDGTTVGPQPEPTAGHAYTTAGTYQISVTVSDGTLSDTAGPVAIVVTPASELGPDFAPTGGKILWGATPAAMGTQTISPANLAALESMTGRPMQAVRIYKQNVTSPWFAAGSNELVMGDGGRRLVVLSFKMAPYTPEQVIAGAADADLAARRAEVAAYGGRVILVGHHEPDGPNGPDMPAATYRALQLHLSPLFKAAANVRWGVIFTSFAGNNSYPRAVWTSTDEAMDAAVDWIGGDPYTFRTGGGAPVPLSVLLSDFLSWAHDAEPGAPVFLAEWGCADDPSNGITDGGAGKAAWFRTAAAWLRDDPVGQRIKAALYYHSPGTVATTPVDSTEPSRAAWAEVSAYPRTFVTIG